MAESLSFEEVLGFLMRNGLSKSEAALRMELESRDGSRKKNQSRSGEMLKDLIVKETEIRSNGWAKKDGTLAKDADLYPWNFILTYDPADTLLNFSELQMSEISSDFKKEGNGRIIGPAEEQERIGGELPKLPRVKIKLEDKSGFILLEEKVDSTVDVSFLMDSSAADYPNEYWDSDEYEDDGDVGYTRQPIQNETWFLAHEIDYPSDTEQGSGHDCVSNQQDFRPRKDAEVDQSLAEEASYFSEEQCFQAKNMEASEGLMAHAVSKFCGRSGENALMVCCDGQLMDIEELNLMGAEPDWHGFVTQGNGLSMLNNGGVINEFGLHQPDDCWVDYGQHGSVRSIGVGIISDVADSGNERYEHFVGGKSGEKEYRDDYDDGIISASVRCLQHDNRNHYFDSSKRDMGHMASKAKQNSDKGITATQKCAFPRKVSSGGDGFSFPPHLRTADMQVADASNSIWVNKDIAVVDNGTDDFGNDIEADDILPTWGRKNSELSPVRSFRCDNINHAAQSGNSTASSILNDVYAEGQYINADQTMYKESDARGDLGTAPEDEEAIAVQEQIKQMKFQEEEFETFDLKIVHRKNRTGFEEDKNFHVDLNSVIAGRYHVTEFLGSAAFSKAIQAHDLHTGIDVCVKIIKNNKDFFDQSLDEIKLLKFVNKNDPADKYHVLRLYDYFYYREHLLIVCELLKANLYEFHKFNREAEGEVYFTMPRLQSIAVQCLEALQFLHGLGLIHCDLKPENILIKSYSQCEVKVIDLGSSCFETDNLSSYVQSRSYRAPEVILGLPYDKKIDIWSLGCIIAELCTGNVLFQNDSPATLLARVVGIIGTIDHDMLAKGRETHKYFSKNHMLYDRNQETNKLEYLIPKKTSLQHRLPMGDQGFIDFVAHLLEVNPNKRPTASEALKHPWLSYPYEPLSS